MNDGVAVGTYGTKVANWIDRCSFANAGKWRQVMNVDQPIYLRPISFR